MHDRWVRLNVISGIDRFFLVEPQETASQQNYEALRNSNSLQDNGRGFSQD